MGGAAAGTVAMLGAAPAYADKIDDAAKKLSEASYPFLKEIDWTSDVYGKLPTASPVEGMKAINSMLKMGAAMDPAALKAGILAHSTAISHVDCNLVTPLSDYTATAPASVAWLHLPEAQRPWMSTTPLPSSTCARTLAPLHDV